MNRWVENCQFDIQSNQEQIRQLEKFRSDYVKVDGVLETLPETLKPRVLVPMGSKCGFFYGHLKHTNEIMVHLGDNYFEKTTASQARKIVAKRVKELDDQISVLQGHKKELDEKLDLAKELNTKNTDTKEIKENFNEQTEKDWIAKHRESVAREREAARKEREQQMNVASKEEDPIYKLLQMPDDDDEDYSDDDDDDEDDDDGDVTEGEEEEDKPPGLTEPAPLLQRSGSIDKKVKWDLDGQQKKELESKPSANIRIRFRHSKTPSPPPSMSSSSTEATAIQTPSDVYNIFAAKPKSILKRTSHVPPEAKQPIAVKEDEGPKMFAPASTAISEKVVERTPLPLSESAQSNAVANNGRVSRFRKERTPNN